MEQLSEGYLCVSDINDIINAAKDRITQVPEFVTVNDNGSLSVSKGEIECFRIAYLDWCDLFYVETPKRKTMLATIKDVRNVITGLYKDDESLIGEIPVPVHENKFSARMISQLCFVLLSMRSDLTTDLVKFGEFELIGSGDKIEYKVEMKLRGCNFITFKFTAGSIDVSTDSISSKQPQPHTLYMSIMTILDMWYMLEEGVKISSLTKLLEDDLEQVAQQYLLRALPVTVKRVVETDFIG